MRGAAERGRRRAKEGGAGRDCLGWEQEQEVEGRLTERPVGWQSSRRDGRWRSAWMRHESQHEMGCGGRWMPSAPSWPFWASPALSWQGKDQCTPGPCRATHTVSAPPFPPLSSSFLVLPHLLPLTSAAASRDSPWRRTAVTETPPRPRTARDPSGNGPTAGWRRWARSESTRSPRTSGSTHRRRTS